jgi:hypothetical protein
MRMYPRTVAAIAASSLLAAFAAQANKGAQYSKPEAEDFKWFVTAGATYLDPSYNDLDYLSITSTTASVRTAVTENIDPGFNWGYYLAAGYMIRDDFDIQASWSAFNSEDSDSAATAGPNVIATLSNGREEILSSSADIVTAHSNEKLTYQQFDAHIGQYHVVHDSLSARVFAGIRYAKIDLEVDNTYTIPSVTDTAFNDYSSKFSGWGPEVGLDLEYQAWDQVGIVGHLAAAFVVGEQEAHSTALWNSSPDQANVKAETETRIVPGIDAKLGLNVDFPFLDNDSIVVEGGYQATYYFNAINQIVANAGVDTYENNYSDVGMMGPYLNVSARW